MQTKIILGYLGLVPFITFTIFSIVFGERHEMMGYQSLIVYGSIIISFLAGIVWGIEFLNQKNFIISIVFSLSGFLAIVLSYFNQVLSMSLLLILFFLFYNFESKINPQFSNYKYMRLRKNLTIWVCGCYLFSILTSFNVLKI